MSRRLRQLRVLFLALTALLLARVAFLQFHGQATYADAANRNSVRTREVRAPRGRIIDRNGVILAASRVAHDLVFVVDDDTTAREIPGIASRLSPILGEPPAAIEERLRRAALVRGRSVVISRDILFSTLAEIAWNGPFLRGVEIEAGPARHYIHDTAAGHLLGYVGEISRHELAQRGDKGYRSGDMIGKCGVEQTWDAALRGKPGLEQYESDPLGSPLRRLGYRSPAEGSTLQLTIDADLQIWAEEALSGKEGAVVIIDPASGDLLALASAPGFRPNAFSNRNLEEERMSLIADTAKPLLSRALLAAYPPASTFKFVTMIAALGSDSFEPRRRAYCAGSYRGQKCWKRGGHGSVDLTDAFAVSCDVYFYQLGEALGIDRIHEAGTLLGMTSPANLGVGSERTGVIPTPDWERANVRGPDGEHWGLGDVRNTAIGQGYVLATPIGVARTYAAALGGGAIPALRIVRRALNSDGTVTEYPPLGRQIAGLSITAENQAILRNAMRAVVTRGTAWPLRTLNLEVGAKTGTAENSHGEDHAWMVAATPLDRKGPPDLVIAVLIVHGEHGSSGAGPVVRYVLDRWVDRKDRREAS